MGLKLTVKITSSAQTIYDASDQGENFQSSELKFELRYYLSLGQILSKNQKQKYCSFFLKFAKS